jgi:peptidoglycan/xylan/chitin deacetylase (PgdA/CDA1 family)
MFKAIQIKMNNIIDEISIARMDILTGVAKQFLPYGYWGEEKSSKSTAYLTFDDGPHPSTTPILLEILEEAGIKATFFLIGNNAERYPELVEAIAKAGHTIGNHSHNHLFMPMLTVKKIEDEIVKTNACIKEITKSSIDLFRAPYGITDQRIISCLKEQNMTAVYWGKSPEDWTKVGSERIAKRVTTRLASGTIIVLHEGHKYEKQTIGAAKEIIYKCKDLKYQLEAINLSA